MFVLRTDQLEAVAAGSQRSRAVQLAARLRQEFPAQCDGLPAGQLERQVREGMQAAMVLGLADGDRLHRFLRLRHLSPATWERAGAQEMLVRILTDTALDPDRRLRFIEAQLAPGPRRA